MTHLCLVDDIVWVVTGWALAGWIIPLCFLATLFIRSYLRQHRIKHERVHAKQVQSEVTPRSLLSVTKDAFEEFNSRNR